MIRGVACLMQLNVKKTMSLLGILLLMSPVLFSRMAMAEGQSTDSLNIENGSISISEVGRATQAGNTYTFSNDRGLRLTGTSDQYGVTVRYGVGTGNPVNLKLDNLQIDTSKNDLCAFSILENASVVIELMDGTDNRLTSADYFAGLQAQNLGGKAGEVRITGTGSLTSTGGRGSAGIGGAQNITHWYGTGGNISIDSGKITATGGEEGAGIGGGYKGDGGVIRISGGTVTAQGGKNAAGIGGEHYGLAGSLDITAENITAQGSDGADSIGNGADYTEKNAGETVIEVQQSTDLKVDAVPTAPPAQTAPQKQEEASQENPAPVKKAGAGNILLSFGLLLLLMGAELGLCKRMEKHCAEDESSQGYRNP